MKEIESKGFSTPDETRSFVDKGRVELLQIGGEVIGRAFFEPGWRWSRHIKPLANTESCQFEHMAYVLQGRMHIVMDDGREIDAKPGDVVAIPPGHDAWTVGDETCIMIDFTGLAKYALPQVEVPRFEQPEAQPSG